MSEEIKKDKKDKKKNSKLTTILLVFFIGIGIFAGYNIIKIVKQYYADQESYKKLSELANSDIFTGVIDFDKLHETSPDVVAWIYRKDSKINYPIVQGTDNSKYLNHLADGSYGAAGTPFVDYQTDAPFEQFDTMVYGHHMKDGSMFAILKKYLNTDYCNENIRFELITPTAKYHMDVVAFLHVREDSNLYIMNQDAYTYDSLIRSNASYTTDVGWTTDDKLVLLSTCAYEFEGARYIVVGKLIPWTEAEIKKAELIQLKLDNAKKKK